MKQSILIILIFIAVSCNDLMAQETSPDEIHLKNFGTQIGKVIKITDNSVEFRSDSNYMFYDYPKKDIDFIILSTGEWITFNKDGKANIDNSENSWGYFSLSGGGLLNQKPLSEAAIRKRGFSFLADLDYQAGHSFSTGFQISYNELNNNNNAYLAQNGYSDSNSTVTGGYSYLLSVGLINRIFLFPHSFVKPIISLFVGYGNLLIARTEIVSTAGGQVISDLSKRGFLAGTGAAIFIEIGNRSGFILESKYNWLFYKKENLQFINFNIGYVIPIN